MTAASSRELEGDAITEEALIVAALNITTPIDPARQALPA